MTVGELTFMQLFCIIFLCHGIVTFLLDVLTVLEDAYEKIKKSKKNNDKQES